MTEQLNEHFDDGMVECKVCGGRYKFITERHLKKHGMTTEEYKATYPDAKIAGTAFSKIQKRKDSELFKKDKNKDSKNKIKDISKTVEDFENELPLPDKKDKSTAKTKKDELDIELDIDDNDSFESEEFETDSFNFDDELENDQYFKETFKKIKLDHKYNVAKFLYYYFQDVLPDYLIKFKDHEGMIIDTLITDFADPFRMVAFFFPDVYWHNEESPVKDNKYRKLKENGWEVIEVKGRDVISGLADKI